MQLWVKVAQRRLPVLVPYAISHVPVAYILSPPTPPAPLTVARLVGLVVPVRPVELSVTLKVTLNCTSLL